ncbi:hypothetical protein XENTR_v10008916 [Xenopus tropicalis]|nr:hypothetical protein XENTR_v10008916 [Xenopus tropicalis]
MLALVIHLSSRQREDIGFHFFLFRFILCPVTPIPFFLLLCMVSILMFHFLISLYFFVLLFLPIPFSSAHQSSLPFTYAFFH